MEQARAYIIISGMVQGVWFRAFVQRTAQAVGLTGWVKNMPDGSVEATIEGAKPAIEMVILECKKGPPSSRVQNVSVDWQEITGQFDSFTIE